MADELIDIFDENNISLNKTMMKSKAHKTGAWHRVSHIWIYNSKGEMLIQHRNQDKEIHPNLWDIGAAGHIPAGETEIDGAIRETKEEIGLKITAKELEFVEIKKGMGNPDNVIQNNEYAYIYLLKYEGKIENLRMQKEELQGLKFIKLVKLKTELKKNSKIYVPHFDYWDEMIDIIENKLK